MTIAEKLNTIAENEKNVYRAGISEGYVQGKADGHADGYTDGKQAGYDEGYDVGVKSEYDRFWDSYQDNGSCNYYNYLFAGKGWDDETFKPKYDIIPTSAAYMFAQSGIKNLKEILDELGVTLDFSKNTIFTYTFQSSSITNIGILDTRSSSNLSYVLFNANYLERIEKLILKDDGSQTLTTNYSFIGMLQLKNIEIDGSIGMSVSFKDSKLLTLDSIKSILISLKSYADTTNYGKYQIYLSDESWSIIDADGATSPTGTTWKQYITDKGWIY